MSRARFSRIASRCLALLAAAAAAGCAHVGIGYEQSLGSATVKPVPSGPCCQVSGGVSAQGPIAALVAAVILVDGLNQVAVSARLAEPPRGLPARPPEPDPARRVSEQDCTRPLAIDGGNLRCR